MTGPPAFAWDWFARQRLLWREVRSRLADGPQPTASRYGPLEERAPVVALLRADYPQDPTVRSIVDEVVRDLVFLGRTDQGFAALGLRNAPRGLRWWWSALGGDDPGPSPAPNPSAHHQLTLDELATDDLQLAMHQVHEGFGDP